MDNVNINKLLALAETFEHETFMDMVDLDDIQKTELIERHATHSRLFSVMMDYIRTIQAEIDSKNDD